MRRSCLLTTALLAVVVLDAIAQHVAFPDEEMQRGYYNCPYKRYEAEPDRCQSEDVIFLAATIDQRFLQSEASNQQAIELLSAGSYVEWINEEAADGMTIRFSLPDSDEGIGTTGVVDLYVNDQFVRSITLDSYWAWQWFRKNDSNKYPDNSPAATSFPRMRFDEIHLKLDEKIPANASFRLVKADDNDIPYVIDFVELEPVPAPVTFESIPDNNKVMFEGGNLSSFINNNGGKTIFIPEGKYRVSQRIYLRTDGTKLIGAGMWYTEIFFDADHTHAGSYSQRGIESNNNNIVIEGLYLNTINNHRYLNSDNSKQVGKALMGSFGSNSIIRNVWAEHFECGAWIANYGSYSLFSDNLLVQHCRFRNNYADGINLCRGTRNAVVEYCSFRNNGDDDMASWSAAFVCQNNSFRYCTAEHNWRASSLGIFGGENLYAHHLLILDGLENGVRVNGDFDAKEGVGNNCFEDISIYRCGAIGGNAGERGDLWGGSQAAFQLATSNRFNLKDIRLINIDIYDTRKDALLIKSSNRDKKFENLTLRNIQIDGTGGWGICYESPRGDGIFCNLTFNNIGSHADTNTIGMNFHLVEDCSSSSHSLSSDIRVNVVGNRIVIEGYNDAPITLYDSNGRLCFKVKESRQLAATELRSGIYIVAFDHLNDQAVKVIVNH